MANSTMSFWSNGEDKLYALCGAAAGYCNLVGALQAGDHARRVEFCAAFMRDMRRVCAVDSTLPPARATACAALARTFAEELWQMNVARNGNVGQASLIAMNGKFVADIGRLLPDWKRMRGNPFGELDLEMFTLEISAAYSKATPAPTKLGGLTVPSGLYNVKFCEVQEVQIRFGPKRLIVLQSRVWKATMGLAL
jgi:hypothetical protein